MASATDDPGSTTPPVGFSRPPAQRKNGSSDQCVFCFVDAQDLQFEEGLISEPVGLSFHGLDLGIGPFQRSCGDPIVVVGQDSFLEALRPKDWSPAPSAARGRGTTSSSAVPQPFTSAT